MDTLEQEALKFFGWFGNVVISCIQWMLKIAVIDLEFMIHHPLWMVVSVVVGLSVGFGIFRALEKVEK
jgi:hypothetical protein